MEVNEIINSLVPENLNRTEDMYILRGDNEHNSISLLTTRYPLESGVEEIIEDEFNYHSMQDLDLGVHIISGKIWSTFYEMSGDYDAGFNIDKHEVLFDAEKIVIDRADDIYNILFLIYEKECYIMKFSKSFDSLTDESYNRMVGDVYEHEGENGVYIFTSEPISYMKRIQKIELFKKIDIPVFEHENSFMLGEI